MKDGSLKHLFLFIIFAMIVMVQSCKPSDAQPQVKGPSPSKAQVAEVIKSKNTQHSADSPNSIPVKALDQIMGVSCLFKEFRSEDNDIESFICSSIVDLKLDHECVIHLSMEKVKELQTYFQSYDLLVSKRSVSSATKITTAKSCPNGLNPVKIEFDPASKYDGSVYLYGIKSKKKYTHISCR